MNADLLIVGGGLAGGLIAWRLRQLRPGVRVVVLEAGATLGGNHTWSFHQGDLEAGEHAWIAPLVAHRWTGHEVRFPAGRRVLAGGYASISAERFHAVLATELAPALRLGTAVSRLAPDHVALGDGSVLRADAVLDARGAPPAGSLRLGFQKFMGRELVLAEPHGLQQPVLMDATVPQQGGYRFVYTLPLDAHTLLVEDTCYADDPALDRDALREGIDAYARAQGWRPVACRRQEEGALPIVLDGDIDLLWPPSPGVPRAGLAAGLFHPTTGYSLPDAVRVADLVAALPSLAAVPLHAALRQHALQQWRRQRFFRLLNRMLFQAASPAARWRVMQRFYQLPEPLIARFYAGRPTWGDRLRILAGKPPVPLGAAWQAAFGAHALPGGSP